MKIYVVGIGPGDIKYMSHGAIEAIAEADVITGYTCYVELIENLIEGKEIFTTPMKQEVLRCKKTLEYALSGKTVAMVCSGDAGVYGMAGILCEVANEHPEVEIEVVPGISACLSGAAVLGAPLMHDFAVISLSDLLTPWEKIEKRLLLASEADFSIVLYNPTSKKRCDYLIKARELMLKYKAADTPCGCVKNIGRKGEESKIFRLSDLTDDMADMFSTVFVGNSQTKVINGRMVTPRGYKDKNI